MNAMYLVANAPVNSCFGVPATAGKLLLIVVVVWSVVPLNVITSPHHLPMEGSIVAGTESDPKSTVHVTRPEASVVF